MSTGCYDELMLKALMEGSSAFLLVIACYFIVGKA